MKINELKFEPVETFGGKNSVKAILKTENGTYQASPAYGTSAGIFEVKSFGNKGLDECVKNFPNLNNQSFNSLKELHEHLLSFDKLPYNKLGGNLILGVEIAFLRSLAKNENKPLFKKIDLGNNIPKQLGKVVGGGSHSSTKGPVFQEFLISNNKKDDVVINTEIHKKLGEIFKSELDMEGGWQTNLLEEDVLTKLKNFLDDYYPDVKISLDIAANEFYKEGKYHYKDKSLTPSEHLDYVSGLIKDYNLFYVEDPFIETDFKNFSELKSKHSNKLICGDDLTVTNIERLKTSIKMNSINTSIVKPNQIGSLFDTINYIKELKKNKIISVVSHRSRETSDDFLADLSIGSDYFKIGISGFERRVKLNRLNEIRGLVDKE